MTNSPIKRCVICFDVKGKAYKYRKVTSLYKLHLYMLKHNIQITAYNVYNRDTNHFIKQYRPTGYLPFYFD